MAAKRKIYKVLFQNEGRVYEIYAQSISQGGLFGFVEAEGLLFGERSSVVVDPTEERLKTEFNGVDRTFIPMHAIIRIDEVHKRGTCTIHPISEGTSKVTPLHTPIYTPAKKDK